MHFTKPRPRNPSDEALIPLINVVFLMLIFFMIVGQIQPPEALSVDPPNSRQGRLLEPEHILLLMDAQGRVALEGEVIPASLLGEQLAARLAAAREASASDQDNANDGTSQGATSAIGITLKADAAVTQGQLRVLLDQLRTLGVARLHILSQQPANRDAPR